MTIGNLVAIQQKNLKRLIAYSSIGQVGYMLISIAAIGYGDPQGGINATSGLLIHIIGYVASTLLLFVALTAFYNRTGKENIEDLRPQPNAARPAVVMHLRVVRSRPAFSMARDELSCSRGHHR